MRSILSNANLVVIVALCAALGSFAAVYGVQETVACCCAAGLFIILFFGFLIFSVLRGASCNILSLALSCTLPCLLSLALFEHSRNHAPHASTNDLAQFCGHDVVYEATVLPDDSIGSHIVVAPEQLIYPKRMQLSGKTLIAFSLSDQMKSAQRLRITAYVRTPRQAHESWEFDQSKYLGAHGVYSLCVGCKLGEREWRQSDRDNIAAVRLPDKLTEPKERWLALFDAAIRTARMRMVTAHCQHIGNKMGNLISSIVLGNKAVALDSETTRAYRDVGLSHVLAASGFNLTIVTVMTFFICRLFSRSSITSNIICFCSILCFVALAGPSPSVVRAALMSIAVLLARNSLRSVNYLSVLALAFIITDICDPWCMADLGLQLSYAATIGLLLGSNLATLAIYSGTNRLAARLAAILAIVLIAQASVLPIQLASFWKAGLLFLPANLVAEPLITPITILGFSSSIISLSVDRNLPWLYVLDLIANAIDQLASVPLWLLGWCVHYLSTIAGATLPLGPPPPLTVLAYYGCFFWLNWELARQRYKWISLAAFSIALGCLLLCRSPQPQLTIGVIHDTLVCINNQHEACAISLPAAPATNAYQKLRHGPETPSTHASSKHDGTTGSVPTNINSSAKFYNSSIVRYLDYHGAHLLPGAVRVISSPQGLPCFEMRSATIAFVDHTNSLNFPDCSDKLMVFITAKDHRFQAFVKPAHVQTKTYVDWSEWTPGTAPSVSLEHTADAFVSCYVRKSVEPH